MTKFIKKVASQSKSSSSGCCGVEIKEVKEEPVQQESCCGTTSGNESCCG
ncbi:hypothetical protein GCM10008967_30970 [Bacillus carboniphilus]|uniref:Uncharacterized protein n=1 Tax=Bacillus carboniphilus TaxID=86663 RepID=A0ABP3G7F7_9BACI